MMELTQITAGGAEPSGPTGESGGKGGGFLQQLAESLESASGRPVDAAMLEAWLAGDTPDGLPSLTEITALLEQAPVTPEALPEGIVEMAADTPVDVNALLRGLIAAGADAEEQGLFRTAALQGGTERAGNLRRFLDAMPAPTSSTSAEAFRQQLQSVAGASAAMGAAEVQAPRGDTAQFSVSTPPGQPGFGAAVGERVVWMVRNDTQHARIQLDPPELGPLEIKLTIKGDQASVQLSAQHAVTREATLAEVPRLRAMLGEQGFSGVDVDVAQQHGNGREAEPGAAGGERRDGAGSPGGSSSDDSSAAAAELEGSLPHRGEGLVDHYA